MADKPRKVNTTVPESLHKQLRVICKLEKIRVQEAYKLGIQCWLNSKAKKREALAEQGYDSNNINAMLRFDTIYERNRELIEEALDFLDKATRGKGG